VLWVSGLWVPVCLQVWTNMYCILVSYDTLQTEGCGPVYFVRLWVMTLYIMTCVDQLNFWGCGLWRSLYWRVWTNLFCEIVGYDTVYTDECGQVYFVRLWVMTLYIMTSVDQLNFWGCGLWRSLYWRVWTNLFCEIVDYDTVYTDECGPVYFMRLWVIMTPFITNSLNQFIL
jgi:hypothetical protein